MKKIIKQKGFTLVELLISMSIFVIFMGVIINSYTAIVRSQRDTNDYRIMYVEAREIFETVSAELKNAAINYNQIGVNFNGAVKDLEFISKDGLVTNKIRYDEVEGIVYLNDKPLNGDEVRVTEFAFYVSPKFDPYNPDNVEYASLQFQPKVTVEAKFERKEYELNLRTTISSRFYNVTPKNDEVF